MKGLGYKAMEELLKNEERKRAGFLECFCRGTAWLLLAVTSAHAISYVPEGLTRIFLGWLAVCVVIGVPYGTYKELYIKLFLSTAILLALEYYNG